MIVDEFLDAFAERLKVWLTEETYQNVVVYSVSSAQLSLTSWAELAELNWDHW